MPLELLQGPAAVIDVRPLRDNGQNGVSPLITPEFLERWESRNGPIAEGDVVLFLGGWDEFYAPLPEGAKYTLRPLVFRDHPGWPATIHRLSLLYDELAALAPSRQTAREQRS